jgi:hypothetical protein
MLYTVVSQPAAWRPLQGPEASGDGHELVGVDREFALYNFNTGPKPRLAKWDSSTQRFGFVEREVRVHSTLPWDTLRRDTSRAMQDARLVQLAKSFSIQSGIQISALGADRDLVCGLVMDSVRSDGTWHLVCGPIDADKKRPHDGQPEITAIDSLDGSPIAINRDI